MEIKIETGGLRLDKALSDLTELSRSLANEQIKSGQVLVNGQLKKAKYSRRGCYHLSSSRTRSFRVCS